MSSENVQSRREFAQIVGLGALAAPFLLSPLVEPVEGWPLPPLSVADFRVAAPKSVGIVRAFARGRTPTGVWIDRATPVCVELVYFQVTEEYKALPAYVDQLRFDDGAGRLFDLKGRIFCLFMERPWIQFDIRLDQEHLVLVGQQLFDQAVYLPVADNRCRIPRRWDALTEQELRKYLEEQ